MELFPIAQAAVPASGLDFEIILKLIGTAFGGVVLALGVVWKLFYSGIVKSQTDSDNKIKDLEGKRETSETDIKKLLSEVGELKGKTGAYLEVHTAIASIDEGVKDLSQQVLDAIAIDKTNDKS